MSKDPSEWHPETVLIQGGLSRSHHMETAEAIYMTSGYVYDSAEDAEHAFKADGARYVYSRYANPTVTTLQERLRLIEGAEACVATASGMSAVYNALIPLVKAGDRIVASRALFGSCTYIIGEIMPRFGVEFEFVDGTDLEQWEAALSRGAQAVFLETPSNPTLEIIDLPKVCELAHAAGATVVVDNVFATPGNQKPLELGADVVIYSATKHIDGQGRCMGGAILGTQEYCKEKVTPFIRHTGPSLSPFNAWVLQKGLETLPLRVERQSATAFALARKFEDHKALSRVLYPHLDSHPQVELAKAQMKLGGTMLTLELNGGKEAAFKLLNGLKVATISNNLGDSKTLATHPATTTHQRLTDDERVAMGITDGMLRVSVGLENVDDLINDFERALSVL
ncbi:O-succinylhomoserine sulfhydrylase [Aestuariispira ectoiniformans]|uniref:O-succinylhomoserine sulfhydrylase n=1 Tax=Aestuariispira ectoiniformans TaxID=2775080 RepID=UPI00223A8C5C|nr:O-succinylhomoserine sulfhydrylase [Aestuariispira ectoiniformans]